MTPLTITLGNPKNPALVFLHGFLGSGKSWLQIAQSFSENYFCVLPDLPGHGENTNLDINSVLDFDIVTEWLARLLNQIPVSENKGDREGRPYIHLVGYSLGGRVALNFACRHPGQILSLTLESTSPGIMEESERARRLVEDTARAESILKEGISVFVEKWYQMPLFASLQDHQQTLAAIKAAAKNNRPEWMAKVIRDLSPGLQTPLWDSLSNLSFPVLLIAGKRDEKYVQVIQKMAGRIPSARHLIMAEAGHNVHAEQPEKYIELIRSAI